MYVLYHTTQGGWYGGNSITSEWQSARRMTYFEAIEICQKHILSGQPLVVPVALTDLETINGER